MAHSPVKAAPHTDSAATCKGLDIPTDAVLARPLLHRIAGKLGVIVSK